MSDSFEQFKALSPAEKLLAGLNLYREAKRVWQENKDKFIEIKSEAWAEAKNHPEAWGDIFEKLLFNGSSILGQDQINQERERMALKADALGAKINFNNVLKELADLGVEKEALAQADKEYAKTSQVMPKPVVTTEKVKIWTERIGQKVDELKAESEKKNTSFFGNLFGKKL